MGFKLIDKKGNLSGIRGWKRDNINISVRWGLMEMREKREEGEERVAGQGYND